MQGPDHVMQVWFNPGVKNALTQNASYNLLKPEEIPELKLNGSITRVLVG